MTVEVGDAARGDDKETLSVYMFFFLDRIFGRLGLQGFVDGRHWRKGVQSDAMSRGEVKRGVRARAKGRSGANDV